jgi:hypothetical protein
VNTAIHFFKSSVGKVDRITGGLDSFLATTSIFQQDHTNTAHDRLKFVRFRFSFFNSFRFVA